MIARNYILLITSITTLCCAQSFLKDFFTQAYLDAINGRWGTVESVSGPGSSWTQTRIVCEKLPGLFKEYTIASILDVPCGDFHWMKLVDMGTCKYVGIDIVPNIIDNNIRRYGSTQYSFICADALTDKLPCCDIIISRDFLVHLSNADVMQVLKNFKRSGAKYLLTTTFPTRLNYDITSGGWRPINLQQPPFNFPAPLVIICEECTEQNGIYADKSLALWELESLEINK